jgi:ACS family hexuronate transporter-like MFS transporter
MSFFRHRKRWLIVALLFSLSALNYLDRQALSVLAPKLRSELGFSEVEYSYIVTAFLAAYAIGFGVAGRVLDRVGVKAGVAVAVAFWSVIGMLHAVARNWVWLAALRFLLGLGESCNAPAGAKAVAEWAPRRERALSMAVFSNGFLWGAIIAPPAVSYIALHWGWRWGFLLPGAIGLVWLAAWRRWYDAPERHPGVSPSEREYVLRERVSAPAAEGDLRSLLRDRRVHAFFLARMLTDPAPYFFTFWLPEYLHSARGFSLAMIGAVSWIPFLAADLGGPGGGALSDWLVRRGWTPARARMRLMLAAALVMPLAAVAVRTPSAAAALGLMAALLAAHSCWNANLLTTATEIFPGGRVATVVGLASMGGSLGGMLSTLLTGQAIARLGYEPVFTALGVLHPAAWLLVRRWLRPGSPPPPLAAPIVPAEAGAAHASPSAASRPE